MLPRKCVKTSRKPLATAHHPCRQLAHLVKRMLLKAFANRIPGRILLADPRARQRSKLEIRLKRPHDAGVVWTEILNGVRKRIP